MQSFVDTISKERQSHIDKFNNLTLQQIKTINRKSYIPRRKTKDELKAEAKAQMGDVWKACGNDSGLFSKAPIMKPKLLNPWVLSQVQAPEKASTKFFFMD